MMQAIVWITNHQCKSSHVSHNKLESYKQCFAKWECAQCCKTKMCSNMLCFFLQVAVGGWYATVNCKALHTFTTLVHNMQKSNGFKQCTSIVCHLCKFRVTVYLIPWHVQEPACQFDCQVFWDVAALVTQNTVGGKKNCELPYDGHAEALPACLNWGGGQRGLPCGAVLQTATVRGRKMDQS